MMKRDKSNCFLWTYYCFTAYNTGFYITFKNTLYFFTQVLFYVAKLFKIVAVNM